MDHSYRKIMFKLSIFFIVAIAILLLIVDQNTAEYVILVLSLGVNLFLSALILICEWVNRKRGSKDDA